MIRRFSKLLNRRSFASTKDTQDLKEKFQKLSQHHNASVQHTTEENEEIKLTDHSKTTADLKNKFGGVKVDLEKNTGQAKSTAERLFETAKNFKAPSFSFSDFKEKIAKKDPIVSEKKTEEPKVTFEAKEAEKIEKKEEVKIEEKIENEVVKENVWSKTFTYVEVLKKKSPMVGKVFEYSTDLWKEAFPKKEDKKLKLIKIHEMRKLSKEIDEKLASGEITQDDVPEWKRNALTVIPEKLSYFKRLKNRLSGNKFTDKLSGKTADFMSSDSVKQVKTKIQELKEGITEVKEVVTDTLEDSESKVYQSAKEVVYSSLLETPEAKAVKVMRQSDPDFDIYVMELDLSDIIKEIFNRFLNNDEQYLKGVIDGSGHGFFNKVVKALGEQNLKLVGGNVISISQCTFLGVNVEDKTSPKFSYSFTISYLMKTADIGEEEKSIENENESEFREVYQTNEMFNSVFFVTFTAHPSPDVLTYEHPWVFLMLYPSEDNQRLG